MRKILFAPDSFKGTLDAAVVCALLEEACREAMPETLCQSLPLSDGGEGLVDALAGKLHGERRSVRVLDPLGREIGAEYASLPDGTAVVEMASASGLTLIKSEERDILRASSYGTGQLIADAVQCGARRVLLGIGGSATNDGGMGAAAALGFRFLDGAGDPLPPCAKSLEAVSGVDGRAVPPELRETSITIACDVNNPLCGPLGAARVYARQKGASDSQIERLDAGLSRFADVLERASGRALRDVPGMGAAGGFSLPFAACLGACLKPGLEIVLDALRFDEALAGASLVVTGEGRTDAQSAMGKVVSGVAKRACAKGVPVAVLSGAVEGNPQALYALGVTALFGCVRSVQPLERALANARENLRAAALDLFRFAAAMWGDNAENARRRL